MHANKWKIYPTVIEMISMGLPNATAVSAGDCPNVFIDVGANTGDSLRKFFHQPNCYEVCHHPAKRSRSANASGGRGCKSANETCASTGTCANANTTCFCDRYIGSRCGYEWPYWLPVRQRSEYCAEAFEANPALMDALHATAHVLVRSGRARRIRIHNTTAFASRDGHSSFGIDATDSTGSSLVLSKRSARGGGSVGLHSRVDTTTLDAVRYLRSFRATRVALKLGALADAQQPREPAAYAPPAKALRRAL